MTLLAVIPAFQESRTIESLVRAARDHVDEVVVVDDGSSDETAALAAAAGARVIRHEANAGKGLRLAQAFDRLFSEGAEAILTLDGDGQHDPADIPAFRSASEAAPGALILGDRSADMANMPAGRRRSIRFGNFFIGRAAARRIADAQCGMRLYPRAVWQLLRERIPLAERQHFVFETAILLRSAEAGIAWRFVPIAARYGNGKSRPSHFRPLLDFWRIAAMVGGYLVRRGPVSSRQLDRHRKSALEGRQ